MTNDEKVRAYDEALEKATTYYDNAKVVGDYSAVARYENMFPALVESDDERIRKDIINLIYWLKANPSLCSQYYKDRYDSILAYLEKQKEPVVDKEGMYYYLGGKFIYCGYPATKENPYDFAMSQQKKQKEQKPVEWSEEDENAFKYLHELISWGYAEKFMDAQTAHDIRAWVNERLRPDTFQNGNSRWKPSEEQIEALHTAIYLPEMGFYGGLKDKLRDLYEQLKRIKGDEK